MERLTEADLRSMVTEYEQRTGTRAGLTSQRHLVSLEVLIRTLGFEWTQKYAMGDSAAGTFLRTRPQGSADNFRNQDRVRAFAEAIFNLQDTPGVERLAEQIRKGDLEGGLAELDTARLLWRSGIAFSLVVPLGEKGTDYDFEIEWDGRRIPCDAKCKVEDTEMGRATVINTLKHARSQFPKGRPSVVFMKIPEAWVRQPETEGEMAAAIRQIMRDTSRISLLVFHWEEWYPQPDGGAARVVRVRPEENERARVPLPELAVRLRGEGAPQETGWRRFDDILRVD